MRRQMYRHLELEWNGIVQAYYIGRLAIILMFSEVNSVEFPASNSGKHNLFYTLVYLPKNY
jgi:hypothetical protein